MKARSVIGVIVVNAVVVVPASQAGATHGGAVTASAHKATLRTFAGTWYGHTRSLKITRKGRAKESIGDGCCNPVIDLRLRLSKPRGTRRRASVRARVTWVKVRDKSYFSKKHPAPHVGERRRMRLRNGVIKETLTGATYCNRKASRKGICGA
jgi:hypothetical protein